MTTRHTFTLVAVLAGEPSEALLTALGTSGMVEAGTVMDVVGAVPSVAIVATTYPQSALVRYTAAAAILEVRITYLSGVTGMAVTEPLL